jgi:hypothetical protein
VLRIAMLLGTLAGCDVVFRIDDLGAQPPAVPAVVISAQGDSDNPTTEVTFPLTVPSASNRLLIVSVAMSAGGPAMPRVQTVTWAGMALTLLDAITGVPDGSATRFEQWQLVAPAVTSADVVVHLWSSADTLRADAIVFAGVDQTTPVRASAQASGGGTTGSVTVASAIGDLVESTVGQGNSILVPGDGQVLVFVDNGNGGHSLDNAAGSIAPGATPSVAMTWSFANNDNWQEIAAALEPARGGF